MTDDDLIFHALTNRLADCQNDRSAYLMSLLTLPWCRGHGYADESGGLTAKARAVVASWRVGKRGSPA